MAKKDRNEQDKKAHKPVSKPEGKQSATNSKTFPKRFPFWARFKIGGNHPTLVIDEDQAWDKQYKRLTDGYVHREATHTKSRNNEEIKPNPNPMDKQPMYLKRPTKHPKKFFSSFNHDWEIPKELKDRYDKNNRKKQSKDASE